MCATVCMAASLIYRELDDIAQAHRDKDVLQPFYITTAFERLIHCRPASGEAEASIILKAMEMCSFEDINKL